MSQNKMKCLMTFLLFAAVASVGCVDSSGVQDDEQSTDNEKDGDELFNPEQTTLTLRQMDSCDMLVAYAKEAALERLAAAAQNNFDAACNGEGTIWDNERDTVADSDADIGEDAAGMDGDVDADGNWETLDSSNTNGKSDDGITSFDTNVQEEGVDEADIVKSDGEYLYVLGNRTLSIVALENDGTLTETVQVASETYPFEMILYKNALVIFSRIQDRQVPEDIQTTVNEDVSYKPYYYNPAYTRISIVDISDKSAPKTIREIDYAGEYVSSRRIDGALRVVLSSKLPALDFNAYLDPWSFCNLPGGEAVYQAAVEALIAEVETMIDEITIADILPEMADRKDGKETETSEMVQCGDVFGTLTPTGTGLLSVVSLDLDAPLANQTNIATFGERGIVYASEKSLYLASNGDYVENAWRSGLWNESVSGIHKFDIATDISRAIYKASGTVPGRMLNQFCLGEKDEHLRVASTTGSLDWQSWDNRLTVLKENDGALEEVGHIAGFGAEEEIYGARFLGDKGFVVTFRQTDPLYTFDLSDPENPTLVGEWVGPGFSSYLHPFGDDFIIAVGMEDWQFVMSLYDVSDFANPEMVERVDFSTLGDLSADDDAWMETWWDSPAVNDHRAFRFLAVDENGIVLVPFSGWAYAEWYLDNTWSSVEYFDTGLVVYDVTPSGFTERGIMSAFTDEMKTSSRGISESSVTRSAIVDDTLYAVSPCRVASADLDTPATLIDSLQLFSDYCGEDDQWGEIDADADTDMDVDLDWDTSGLDMATDGSADADTDADGEADGDTDPMDDGMATDDSYFEPDTEVAEPNTDDGSMDTAP